VSDLERVTGQRQRWVSTVGPEERKTEWVRVVCDDCDYISEHVDLDETADALWNAHVKKAHPEVLGSDFIGESKASE